MKDYKVIVAGGRDFNNKELAFRYLNILLNYCNNNGFNLIIVSGMATGADTLGYEFGKYNSLTVLEFPAEWNKYGKSAGYRRNREMAYEADSAIVFWNGVSKGSMHMINIMKELNKPVKVINYG